MSAALRQDQPDPGEVEAELRSALQTAQAAAVARRVTAEAQEGVR